MFRSSVKRISFRRLQSTLSLESELQKIEKAKFLQDTNTKEIFPPSTTASQHIFPKLEDIDVAKDLQTKEFGNTQLGTYYISRTTTGRVPVYTEIRRGQVRETIVRRIEGDVVQLKKDLQKALPKIDPKEFKVSQESKKIVISGDHAGAVRHVLSQVLKK